MYIIYNLHESYFYFEEEIKDSRKIKLHNNGIQINK